MPGPWDSVNPPWRAVVDSISDGVAVVDHAGVQRFVNQAFCSMVGYEASELVGATAPFCYWPEEHSEEILKVLRASMAGGRTDVELVFKHKNGERFPALVHSGVVGADGQVFGYVATVKDITERRRMEQALSSSEQRWRSVAENPFDFVVTIDREYRYTYINHTAPGVRAEDLIGKATPFDFVSEEDAVVMRDACERVFRDAQAGSYELYVPSLRSWFLTIVGPIVEHGVVTGVSMLTRDVTSQRHAEQALRQAQRMEALGRLAGGIAHDFNNLLVPIAGNSELLRSAVAGDVAAESLLDDIEKAAERAKELVSRILLFGRETGFGRERVLIQDLVREVARFISTGAPPHITIQTRIDDSCLAVLCVPSELHQVVTNLCTNAMQALEQDGGTLTLTLEPTTLPAASGSEGSQAKKLEPGERAGSPRLAVRLIVEDDGPGIPEAIQARIFEPFFTTRPVGQGTGLGLTIVHAIATRYEGTVTVESKPSLGARFTVLLPAARARPEPQPARVPQRKSNPSARVLRLVCVDDESIVLRWLTITLQLAGHTVTSFTNPLEAAAYLRANGSQVDCVISDETMPGLSGTQLAHELETTAPGVPVLLLSGYPAARTDAVSANVRKRLQKPLRRPALLEAVLEVVT